ncbi:MAG: M50 family metallopeptidase, partial [Solirubrobacterales bacterium]
MSWVLALSGFAMLVVLHEAGHMIAAKAVGMRVERFFLFFPPKVVSFKRGETEYGIGAIPLGGFVKITGMSPEEEVPEEHLDRAYWRQPVWKRIVVIAAGPAVNIVLALIIFFIIATGFGLNGEIVNRVDSVTPGTPAAGALQEGDRLISIDGTDVSGLQGEELVDVVRSKLEDKECEGEPTDGCMATTPVELEVLRGETNEQFAINPELFVPSE